MPVFNPNLSVVEVIPEAHKHVAQGFSNFFLEGLDEIPMKPERART